MRCNQARNILRQIVASINQAFRQAAYCPAVPLQACILACVTSFVLMPVYAVGFNGDLSIYDGKVDAISTHLVFRHKWNAEGFEGKPNLPFDGGFGRTASITRETTKPPMLLIGQTSKLLSAGITRLKDWWTAAFFGAKSAVTWTARTLLVSESLPAPLTFDPIHIKTATFLTAIRTSIQLRGVNLNRLAASLAIFSHGCRPPMGLETIERTVLKIVTVREKFLLATQADACLPVLCPHLAHLPATTFAALRLKPRAAMLRKTQTRVQFPRFAFCTQPKTLREIQHGRPLLVSTITILPHSDCGERKFGDSL